MRREGEGFDVRKELEGELYKLGMVLDDLDHTVEGNRRMRPSKRVPFQGTTPVKADHPFQGAPVKADHSINVHAMRSSGGGREREVRDVAGVMSLGGGASVDGRLQDVEEGYDGLMERYEQLKRMNATPERAAELDILLKVGDS